MLIPSAIAHVICWLLFYCLAFGAVMVSGEPPDERYDPVVLLYELSTLFLVIYCILHPWICFSTSSNFRLELLKLLPKKLSNCWLSWKQWKATKTSKQTPVYSINALNEHFQILEATWQNTLLKPAERKTSVNPESRMVPSKMFLGADLEHIGKPRRLPPLPHVPHNGIVVQPRDNLVSSSGNGELLR